MIEIWPFSDLHLKWQNLHFETFLATKFAFNLKTRTYNIGFFYVDNKTIFLYPIYIKQQWAKEFLKIKLAKPIFVRAGGIRTPPPPLKCQPNSISCLNLFYLKIIHQKKLQWWQYLTYRSENEHSIFNSVYSLNKWPFRYLVHI